MMNIADLILKIQLDKRKITLAGIILILVLYIDFTFILKAQFNKLRIIKPKVAQLKKDIEKLNKDLTSLSFTKENEQRMQETVEKTMQKVINESSVPKVLGDIAKVANNYQVKIMQVRPLKSSATKKVLSTAAGAKLTPLSIELEILGGYHQFGKFLNDLENAAVFMQVDRMQIRAEPTSYLSQNINLTLKIYVK